MQRSVAHMEMMRAHVGSLAAKSGVQGTRIGGD